MLKVIEGDILDIDEGFIIHQVNCQNVMGSGVAKALYTKYPIVKSEYHDFFSSCVPTGMGKLASEFVLGHIQWVMDVGNKRETEGKILTVVNIFSQEYFGRNKTIVYTDYKALDEAIATLKSQIVDYDIHSSTGEEMPIYAPHGIGCGTANGDWNIVSKILEKHNIIVVKLGGKKL